MSSNNLQAFRACISSYLQRNYSSALSIPSYIAFTQLISHLCNQKLLHPLQVKHMLSKITCTSSSTQSSSQVKFPLLVKEFQNIIMVEFGDEQTKKLLKDLKDFNQVLRGVKGVVNVWQHQGMTNQEKAQLKALFAKNNDDVIKLCDELKRKRRILQSISEQEIQMIKALDQWVVTQNITKKFKDYKDFQTQNKQIINDLFLKEQVKESHFKKALNNVQSDISTVAGFSSTTDLPIQITLISKSSSNFQQINRQLLRFDALKQLGLSQFFVQYYGFNTGGITGHFLYYQEIIEGNNLQQLIRATNMTIDTPLIKYWIWMVFKAFYDLFQMCSYHPLLDINLKDFQVTNFGLRLVIKNIRFVNKRVPHNISKSKIDKLQTQLLRNLGLVILQLLNVEPTVVSIEQKFQLLQQKCLLKALLNIQQSHSNYQNKYVEQYLSFFNLQTHPLFEQSQFLDGSLIVENYLAVYGNR